MALKALANEDTLLQSTHCMQTRGTQKECCVAPAGKRGSICVGNNVFFNNVFSFARAYLTNSFHVAVRLFSNRSQMTSKCGKNKKVAHEA